ncbi:Dynein assembly factor 4, axonemal [Phlyctochytrium planicorne]|nr:Dynein assembly factor 4, axonemal [Phlyctochytrium planicorne]
MTILLEYDFEESEEKAYVVVKAKGIVAHKADVYANDSYIKVNYDNQLFEADLAGEIDTDLSNVSIGADKVTFDLKKKEHKIWGSLTPLDLAKDELRKRRDAALQRAFQKEEDAKRKKAEAKQSELRMLVQKQIEVERAAREKVEALKAAEKKQALEFLGSSNRQTQARVASQPKLQELDDLWETTEDATHEDIKHLSSSSSEEDEPEAEPFMPEIVNEKTSSKEQKPIKSNTKETSDEESSDDDDLDMEAIRKRVRAQMEARNPNKKPSPRSGGRINVSFTTRGVLPTPVARESEDAKWKLRIKSAREDDVRKRIRNEDDSISENEKNPLFLQEKGNLFLRSGNYASAINAYTAALELDKELVQYVEISYANRALAYISVGEEDMCIADCEAGLDCIASMRRVEKERGSSIDKEFETIEKALFIRRGAAFFNAGREEEALQDYQKAHALDPDNITIQEDLNMVAEKIRSQSLILRSD